MSRNVVNGLISATWWPELLSIKDRHSYSELAEKFGVSSTAIKRALHRLGATKVPMPKGPRARRAPRPDGEAVIGTVRPAESSARTMRTFAAARTPSSAERLEAFRDEIGKVPDHEIAARAGLKRGVVGEYRRSRGIPAYEGYKFERGHTLARARPRPVDPGAGSPTPIEAPVAEAASTERRARRTRLDAHVHLIGVVSDAEVARLAGVTAANVRAWRVRRGVPAAPRTAEMASAGVRRRGPRSAIEPFEHLVGKVPDVEIARLADVSLSAAVQFRRRRGIAGVPVAETPAPEAPAAPIAPIAPIASAPTAPVTTDAPRTAFRVIAARGAEVRRFCLLAADILEATARAHAALTRKDAGWEIRSVRAFGEALG